MVVVLIAMAFAVASNVLGGYFSKQYAETGSMTLAVITVLTSAVSTVSWCFQVRYWQRGIAVVGMTWDVASVLLVVAVGLLQGERLSVAQSIGVVLSVLGVALVVKG